jgi:hypothetical protein
MVALKTIKSSAGRTDAREVAWLGAQLLMQAALEAEVSEFHGRGLVPRLTPRRPGPRHRLLNPP